MVFGVGAAQASTLETFDTPVVTGPTAAPGVWYTDRFAPAGFQTSDGVLHETISGADHQAGDPDLAGGHYNFYNTQGRAFDLPRGLPIENILPPFLRRGATPCAAAAVLYLVFSSLLDACGVPRLGCVGSVCNCSPKTESI